MNRKDCEKLNRFLELKEQALLWIYSKTNNLEEEVNHLFENLPQKIEIFSGYEIDIVFDDKKATDSFSAIVLKSDLWKNDLGEEVYLKIKKEKKPFFFFEKSISFTSNCRGDLKEIKKVTSKIEEFFIENLDRLIRSLETTYCDLKRKEGLKEFGLYLDGVKNKSYFTREK